MLKYQKVGDIVLVKRDLSQEEIDYIVNKTRCKTIVKYEGIKGDLRRPKIKIIYGSETETIHKEYGCLFKLDVSKVMWSMGNIEERKRMAHISHPREVVVDMFAGIGYFSIPMAKYSRPKRIYGVEINPDAYYYLEENIRLNKLKNVVPILEDNRNLDLENIADRVIMGYILKTRFFLDKAFQLLKEEGGVIHYHDTLPEKAIYSEGVCNIIKTAENYNYRLTSYHVHMIKKYAPGVWHIVIDARVEGR
ncbi:class I SAM-dependent methyltransferase family protein [Methanofervidicoccus sp. A16]|uniref:tRNA(Phe) (4-demethylwyosine(37)-C(7)) aminocarboxypropyltransferase Taw2 n=1 Tax=Methanofervidicoccus sp. A16 TaxID=2607662 RepID=UPI00155894A6|nr:class I SAM-dependent methyltransferase family protein [Methanofervidicoccus sp. A16]